MHGGTIHSGSCIKRVDQEHNGSVVTIVVTLMPADNRCAGEFNAMVPLDADLTTVKLGVPKSGDPNELGVIWTRSR